MDIAAIVAALDGLEASAYEGKAYRHISAGRDPLSGEGARRAGGRWNPPNSFAVLYLALDVPTTLRELTRSAAKQGLKPLDFLPRELFTYEVRLQHVLDLRVLDHVRALGTRAELLGGDDVVTCQEIGEAAHHVGFEALLAPSAAAVGDVLAVFVDRMLPDSFVRPVAQERWDEIPEVRE